MHVLQLLSQGAEGVNTELVALLYAGMAFFFAVIAAGWFSAARQKPEPPVESHSETPQETPKAEKKITRKK